MKITFSRHARRRMKLYRIDEKDVVESVTDHLQSTADTRVEVVDEKLALKYRYPLKTVLTVERGEVIVVTTYPLKGKRKS